MLWDEKIKALVANKYHVLGYFFVAVIITAIITLSLVPPVSRDALTHHLAVPKLYLKHGGVYEIPYLKFSYYPMNLDFLYILPLYFGNDIFPKFIHFTFALFTAYLVFRYLEKRINRHYAIIGVVLLLTIPVIIKLSTTVYVDLGLVFFSTASIVYIFRWLEHGFRPRYLIISSLLCGLALGTKYNGLILYFILTLFVPFYYLKVSPGKGSYSKALCFGFLFFIVAGLIFSPWLIRNYLWTGNPIYPLYDNIINPEANRYFLEGAKVNHFVLRSVIYGESFWDIILIPVRIFFQGQDDNPQFFDGKLNPLLFIMPFCAFFGRDRSRTINTEKHLLVWFSILYLLFAFFQRDMRIRYIAPIIPPLVILSIYGLDNILYSVNRVFIGQARKAGAIIIWGVFLFFLATNFYYLEQKRIQTKTFDYITGKVSRDEYLEKHLKEYPVLRFSNENLPIRAVILSLFMGNRGYYSDRKILFEENLLFEHLKGKESADDIRKGLCQKGITHILIRYDLFQKYVLDNFDGGALKGVLSSFVQEHLRALFSADGYGLFKIKGCEINGMR
jgi:hypothetical protein